VRPIILFLFAFLFLSSKGGEAVLAGPFFLLALISGIFTFISYKTSEFGITNRRVLIKVGFIRRKSLEIFLTHVEGIFVKQGILGRILNYGTIIVNGTGGTKTPFHNIRAPLEFRKKVQEQIEAMKK